MEERTKETEIMHEIVPKFNFIYELGMPTGKKIKSTLILILIFIVSYIALLYFKDNIQIDKKIVENVDIVSILNMALIIGVIFAIIKLIVHVVFKVLQYRSIKYTFYKDHMIYEDSFLNQHKKNIKYENIKEVEIRRSVWDRLLGYGIIVIYTNAENEYSNGLVIFSIQDTKKHYDIIDSLVHCFEKTSKESDEKNEEVNVEQEENVQNVDETHEEFLESLKHIEK